jgi:GDP-D-mannose 3',5'-epimerase
MKRALVTGGGGFVGGHLVRRLKSDGYWVRAVDRVDPTYGATSADAFVPGRSA